MGVERYIRIREPRVFDDRILVFDVFYSRQIRKYFSSDRFYVEYEKDITGLDPSILCIPAVSGVITVAWAIGADIHVETLDQTYLRSISEMRPLMRHLHPHFSYSTEINVKGEVSNRFSNDRYGLLFTGGIDSVASHIKHKQEKPDLIKVWGAGVPFNDERTWKRVRRIVADFADKEGVRLHAIRTNIPRVLKDHVLHREFGLEWWLNVSHGIVLTGLCAPLTSAAGIGALYIASGNSSFDTRARISNSLYNKIGWGDIKVVRDNYEVSRQLKIRYFLKDYIKDRSPIFLKVCNVLPTSNCGKCEKCLRTIIGLVIEGIDPNKCGFNNVNSRTFELIKEGFTKKNLFARKWIVEKRTDLRRKASESSFWRDVQKNIPEALENNLRGSEGFLEWFRTFNITEYMEEIQNDVKIPLHYFLYRLILNISMRLPESIHNAIKRLLDLSMKL